MLDHIQQQRPRREVSPSRKPASAPASRAAGRRARVSSQLADCSASVHAMTTISLTYPTPRPHGRVVGEDFPREVAAAFRLHLVFEVEGGDAGAGVLLRRARDHQRPTVARVGVGDERGSWRQVGEHLCVAAHVVQCADAQVCLPVYGGRGAGACVSVSGICSCLWVGACHV